jgi:Tol biopolymer transport system component
MSAAKPLTTFLIAVFLLPVAGAAQTSGFPKLSGPYLGQKPPGLAPEVFAPGVVSKEGHQAKLFFTPDGSEAVYDERDPASNTSHFVWMRSIRGVWAKPVIIPFSTAYINNEPCLSPDGKKLVFVSNRPSLPRGEAGSTPDLWMSERTEDGWGEPFKLGPAINTPDIEVQPYLSSDGKLYFMRQNGGGRQLLCASFLDGESPEPISLGGDVLPDQVSGPCVSPDNRVLVLHSRMEGGFGSWDLYASFRDPSGNWGKPINLGKTINTEGSEGNATFSPDGRFLFFTRDGDIFWVSSKCLDALKPSDLSRLTGPYLGQKPPGLTPKVFAPGIISTADAREFSGAFTPDGKEYYFFRFADGAGMMMTRQTPDGWTEPRTAPFNTENIDNEPHVTPDGRRMFFCSNRPYPGSGEARRMTQVWVMRREGNGWGEPKHLGMGMMPTTSDKGRVFIGPGVFELVDDKLVEVGMLDYDPTVPQDERLPKEHTCMAPDESFHVFDFKENLYVSFRTGDGAWGRPIDLSARLNLPEGEMLPTLSPDQAYLFFCNRGDIYWVSAGIIEELRPKEARKGASR